MNKEHPKCVLCGANNPEWDYCCRPCMEKEMDKRFNNKNSIRIAILVLTIIFETIYILSINI